jgi:hypothetical protein
VRLLSYGIDCALGTSTWHPLWAESISGLEMQLGGGPVSVASSAAGGARADCLLAVGGASAVRLLDVSRGEVIWGGDFEAGGADAPERRNPAFFPPCSTPRFPPYSGLDAAMRGLSVRHTHTTDAPAATAGSNAGSGMASGSTAPAQQLSYRGDSGLVAVGVGRRVLLYDTRQPGAAACAVPLPRGVAAGWVQLGGGSEASRLLLAPRPIDCHAPECIGVQCFDVRAVRRERPLCQLGSAPLACFHASDASLIGGGPGTPTLRWGGAAVGRVGDELPDAAEQKRRASKGRQGTRKIPRAKHRLAGGPVNVRR